MPGPVISEDELRAAYARPVQEFCELVQRDGLAGNRRLVAALLLSTLRRYRFGPSWHEDPGTRVFRVLVALFFVISACAWTFLSLGFERVYRPTFNTDVGFYTTAVVGVVCLGSIRLLWSFPGSITFLRRGAKRSKNATIAGFCLGNVDQVFDPRNLRLVVFSFFFLVVVQVTLLSFTRNHCGIAFDGKFVSSLLLTLDNLLHGILFDIGELYGLNLGDRIEHNFWSASIFLFFRLSYDAMFLLFLYLVWRRWTARGLFRGLPATSKELIRWLENELDKGWFKRFPSEYTFLVLAREYMLGRDDVVRTISARFQDLGISDEVRALFVDADGTQVLLPASRAAGASQQPARESPT